MKEIRKFEGIIPPVITIFNQEGEIDREKTRGFIQHLIGEGVHGIFVAGSTGEAPLMNDGQRKEIIDIGVEAARGKVPLFAGTGHNSTRVAVELSRYAEKAGADAAVAFLPHYPKPTQEGFYEHYRAIGEAVSIPVFVYNCFEQYGVEIAPETVARLADEGYIHGIKDSTFDLDHISRVLRLTGGRITVLTGLETKVLPSLVLGADGSICTIANLIPGEMLEIYNLFRQGKIAEAGGKQLFIMGLFDALISSVEPQVVKEGLKILGHDVGDCLPPANKVPAEVRSKLDEELRKLRKL